MDAASIMNGNGGLEDDLSALPDQVADALKDWRIATLDRERLEAVLYARLKAENGGTDNDTKNQVKASQERYEAVLKEIVAESAYNRIYEKLMSVKKLASLRTAF